MQICVISSITILLVLDSTAIVAAALAVFVFIIILYYITRCAYYFNLFAYIVFKFLKLGKIDVTSVYKRNPSELVFYFH